jgi:hypothetical protein
MEHSKGPDRRRGLKLLMPEPAQQDRKDKTGKQPCQ